MVTNNIDVVKAVARQVRADVKVVTPKADSPKPAAKAEKTKVDTSAPVRDMVDVTGVNPGETPEKPEMNFSAPEKAGNYLDYTVNSDNELVIKVKNRNNGSEVRQIPSKAAQAVKQAIRDGISQLFDEQV